MWNNNNNNNSSGTEQQPAIEVIDNVINKPIIADRIVFTICLAFIVSLIVILIAQSFSIKELQTTERNNNITIEEQDIINNQLSTELETPSDVEQLEQRARIAKARASISLEAIEELKEQIVSIELLIVTRQESYEESILESACSLEQIKRKASWEEYHIDFCNDEEQLDTFRTVK